MYIYIGDRVFFFASCCFHFGFSKTIYISFVPIATLCFYLCSYALEVAKRVASSKKVAKDSITSVLQFPREVAKRSITSVLQVLREVAKRSIKSKSVLQVPT